MRRISLLLLLACFSTPLAADEILHNTDGSKRIYVREISPDKDMLVDDTGRLIGYRRNADDDSRATITSRDGSQRLYRRSINSDTDALLDDTGRTLGYRHRQHNGRARYATPDGETVGYSEER
jgi:hypothetical protein